ncbi:sensor histidine kinase [Ensifer sp. SL37]|uniref:sensor histidine kinase n=1 Tax=Ensifer sp. SL37 TaxID=2995137 RepID=UPI002272FE9E|nr:sensor histidine kinase [Ensifer sp. SL37]MCY1745878.1 sensor histidine kinase [Ensifer sp. SL37]
MDYFNGARSRHLDGTMECIGAVQDVSAQRIAEMARDKLRTELAQLTRVKSLSTMAASIAHEVNQPLSGIIMNASASLRMLSATPPNIDGAVETAKRTIRDSNRASDVIMRLIGLLSSDLQRGRILLIEELSDPPPFILGDRVQLQQVVMNLLRNSIDAMTDTAQTQKKIFVRTSVGPDEVRVVVEDHGVGLEGTDVERLFEVFHTTKPKGMGIGLSVSRSIIEAHKRKMWAESIPSGGAIFGFALPFDKDSVDRPTPPGMKTS